MQSIFWLRFQATFLQTLLLNGGKPGTNQSVIPADAIQMAATGFGIEYPVAYVKFLGDIFWLRCRLVYIPNFRLLSMEGGKNAAVIEAMVWFSALPI